AAVLQLQESHHTRKRRDGVGAQQHLRGQRVILTDPGLLCAWGTQHSELPARLILSRGGAVRVKQVPLVQHRVGNGACMVPAGSHEISRIAEFAASSEVIASSKPSRPRAERYAASASMVSRSSRTHPVFGKCCWIRSRQTDTGMSKRSSRSHGTCWTVKPLAPRLKTVPLNRNWRGMVPSRSACRYFATATSKSYVHSRGR